MRFRLNIKIFIFSIIVILCFVASMAFSIDVANRKFEDYINHKEIEKLGFLADTLAKFYSEHGGWGPLIEDRDLWNSLLRRGWESVDKVDMTRPKEAKSKEPIVSVIYHSPVPIWDQLDLGPRICLFDENKKYINGVDNHPAEECTLLPILLEARNIGWLGLIKGRTIYQPLDQAFRNTQSMTLYVISGAFLFILIFIAIIFSRHMLMPITRLAAATKMLGRLNFNTRIPVESSDEIGQLAEYFNDMAWKLEDYERIQKQWLTDISHELRTPLSVLICEIDALKDGIRKPNQELFVSLSNEMRHLIKLVNDINDISLIETGTFTVKKGLVKPLPILSQVLHIFQKRLENNGMSIEIELEPAAADIQIIGDSNRLIQLFTNIFENAIIHTKKPGRLFIRQTSDAEWIKFVFEDSGPGVPDEALPLIFDRLYRLDSSRSRATGGTGLGLAICKSIVEMHNGKIGARNVQGGGLMIEIVLPIQNNPGDSIEEPSTI